jgi:hypothetical protein
MDQQDNNDQAAAAKRRKDKGKFIFLAIISVVVILVYISQQSGVELPDWPGDLSAGLAQAKQEERKVLVFFASSPPSEDARSMSTATLRKNAKHIKSGKFITLLIQGKKTDEQFKRYNVTALPTFLLLDSEGKVLNRRVRFVGEVPFNKGFLDCSDVQL